MFGEPEKADIGGAVGFAAGALLDLFKIPQFRLGMALADGKGAVGMVHEHFAALQVVVGDGIYWVAFRGVGKHEDAEVIAQPEGFELLHKLERLVGGAEPGAIAQAAYIIHDEHLCAGAFDAAFDGRADILPEAFVMRGHLGAGIELGPIEVFGKIVGGVPLVVAGTELVGAQLKINVKHFGGRGVVGEGLERGSAGNLMAELHGEDGFAEVGIGKEDADLVLLPETAKEHLLLVLMALELEPAVGGVNGKKIVGSFGGNGRFGLCGVVAALCFGDGSVADEVEQDGLVHFLFFISPPL